MIDRTANTNISELPGVVNFRDVALSTGVRPGRLFRSGDLSRLGDDGRQTIRRLGITDVGDFRSPGEVDRFGPGQVPGDVEIHRLPILDVPVDAAKGEAPHEHAWRQALTERPDGESVAHASIRYMVEEYRRFPNYNGAQRALGTVVKLLASGRSVLVHCFAGKDRTGLIVALILEAIGIGREAVLADFMRSNDAVTDLRSQVLGRMELPSETATLITGDEILSVREEYLIAARRTIDDSFGSLTNYLRDADITESDLNRLRNVLLA